MNMTTQCNDHRLDTAPASVPGIHRRSGLSRAEEHELAARIANGDHEARNHMVRANLRLVSKIALAFRGRGLPLDDLIGEGNLGLIRAAQEFDPRFGTRFSTYAAYWIKEGIHRALVKTTATIRLPAHMEKLLTKWRRAERKLHHQWNRRPTFGEVAAILGLSEGQKSLVAKAQHARRLMLESNASGESGSWLSNEVTDRLGPIDERLETDDERTVAFHRMVRLDDRERVVLTLRFGLEGEFLTYQELGWRFGMTREWVRQIELRALCKLGDERSDQASGSPAGSRSQIRRHGGSAVPA
jgi:RNA polymerase primary sigma factor